MLAAAITRAGIADPATGQPLSYTPHDFRRIFITDAVLNGLPPHIAQVIAGHRDINVTMGYKAVYPDEAIQAHRAHLARRRALRPSGEYRAPTDAEWQQSLGHFERRKVATGTCGRAFATPCPHEHACLTEMILRRTAVLPRAFQVTQRYRGILAAARCRACRGSHVRHQRHEGAIGGRR